VQEKASNLNRDGEANKLIELVKSEKELDLPVTLDDLIELLDADDLRNIAGMVRPKGRAA
jgi:hypothetical protein